MRIVIKPEDDGEREIAVYSEHSFDLLQCFTVQADEQAELKLDAVQKGRGFDSVGQPRDAAEVFADIELKERRIVSE